MITFFFRPRWWLTFLLTLGLATPTQAQEAPPMLVVSIRDQHGTGIAGVQIVVRDLSGQVILGRAETGAGGTAEIQTVPTSDVLVGVIGTLPNGVTLRLSSADERGIAVILSPPTMQLDLRVTPDGVVVPDPATMITLDPGVPVDSAVPTALPAPTARAIPTATLPGVSIEAANPTDATHQPWLLYAVVAGLTAAACTLFVLQARWRREG